MLWRLTGLYGEAYTNIGDKEIRKLFAGGTKMPVGIIVNSISIVAGGIAGACIGGKLSEDFKDKLNMIFGCCSMAMGFCAGLIFPLTTEAMINDFKACGGFLMLATGFRMLKVKMFGGYDSGYDTCNAGKLYLDVSDSTVNRVIGTADET
jgi:hypothetical protein